MSDALAALERLTVVVPDFPSPGILFRDLTPVFADADALRALAIELTVDAQPFDAVAGVEARGFVLAAAVAMHAGTGMHLIRKAGKLPRPLVRRDYALEYGAASLELGDVGVGVGTRSRILLIDDVLATGGTLEAAAGLLTDAGLTVAGIRVAVEIIELGGRARLGSPPFHAVQRV